MTFPDIEMSGAVLIARATGMALGENCIRASMYGLGRAPKYWLFSFTTVQRT